MYVDISNHAYNRWLEYCGNKKKTQLAALVERHLYAALRQGAELEKEAVQLEINRHIKAVVIPQKSGGWKVLTFYERRDVMV
jgi:hypothetical protein